jgi:DMSO/TMAO reductase YedYZ molybdopterin-dependent catalytic subunit
MSSTAASPAPTVAALAGLVSAAAALGVGELVAGVDSRLASPVEAVAREVIDRAPRPVERFAIETFGTNDKLALVVGTVVLAVVLGAVLGVVARGRPRAAVLGLGGFAALGALAALSAPSASPVAALPSLVAGAAGIGGLWLLLGRTRSPEPPAEHTATAAAPAPAAMPERGADPAEPQAPPAPAPARSGVGSRRAFLGLTAGLAAAAALAGAGGRALRSRFSAAESRAGVVLPRAARPLPAVPASAEVGVPGVAPFVTPNADFYRIDTALVVPQVRAEDWSLRVTGMVDEPLELSFAELLDRDLVEADITLTCVSNPVGGDLVGNARWLGVPVADLLATARPRRGADQLVGRSVDGYTCGFPLAAASDRQSLVAVGMNGEPLPLRHGFPARLVTPGIYGYAGSTKWLTELEVTTFDAFDQYWVPRGYARRAPIKTMTRIDTPRSFERVAPGRVVIGGVAWAQSRGIDAVEISIDGEPFRPTDLGAAVSDDSWRQWRHEWDATPGRHMLVVRATDGTGEVQTDDRSETLPDGASGWMSLVVTVDPEQPPTQG